MFNSTASASAFATAGASPYFVSYQTSPKVGCHPQATHCKRPQLPVDTAVTQAIPSDDPLGCFPMPGSDPTYGGQWPRPLPHDGTVTTLAYPSDDPIGGLPLPGSDPTYGGQWPLPLPGVGDAVTLAYPSDDAIGTPGGDEMFYTQAFPSDDAIGGPGVGGPVVTQAFPSDDFVGGGLPGVGSLFPNGLFPGGLFAGGFPQLPTFPGFGMFNRGGFPFF